MGLILAIIVAAVTGVLCVIQFGAAMMTDNTQYDAWGGIVATALFGTGITGILLLSHYHHFTW